MDKILSKSELKYLEENREATKAILQQIAELEKSRPAPPKPITAFKNVKKELKKRKDDENKKIKEVKTLRNIISKINLDDFADDELEE